MQFFFLFQLLFARLSAKGLALNKMITKEGIMNQQGSVLVLALKKNGEKKYKLY